MWEIYEHRRLTKALPKLPEAILKRYEKWKGHRSSRLGQQYRVIYQVEANEVLVYVMDLTAHDYRRK